MGDSRAFTAYKLAAQVARALPEPAADVLARVAGIGAAQLGGERRAQVERNLRRVHGAGFGGFAMRRAVASTYESYARYWAESFRLPGMSAEEIDADFSYTGWQHIEQGLAAGNGVIVALPHLGGWEWAGFWVAVVQRQPITVVVEALEPRELFDWFVELRQSLGMHVIPLGPDAGTEVIKALKANHVVCLLSDRSIDGGGIEAEFFGERTHLPGGPATLALRTRAPLVPTAIYFRGRGHAAVVRPPIPVERQSRLREDVERVTQVLACELEALIRVAPEQWHLMQPNWPSDRQGSETAGPRAVP